VQATPTFSFFNLLQFIPTHPPTPYIYIPRYLPPMAVPEICISLAPPSENRTEPFSPFDGVHIVVQEKADDYRPALLSPPHFPVSIPKHLSPLSPADAPVKGQGLERERFEQLLQSSRERSAALGNKRSPDLRKELAVKTYKSKQCAFEASSSLILVPR